MLYNNWFRRIFLLGLTTSIFILNVILFIFIFLGIKEIIIFLIMQLLSFILVLEIYNNEQNISYKLTWIILIFGVPLIGSMLYVLFGGGKISPNNKHREFISQAVNEKNDLIEKMTNLVDKKICQGLYNNTKYPLYNNAKTEFYRCGEEFFKALFMDICKAEKYLFIEFFIFSQGKIWEKLKKILIEKALQGVEIKLLFDDLGSKRLINVKEILELNKYKNIRAVAYTSLGYSISFAINYRDHRKITVIDGKKAYIGGINIGDEYANIISKYGHWRDNAMLIYGNGVRSYVRLFIEMWYMCCDEKLDYSLYQNDYKEDSEAFIFPFGDGPDNQNNPTYALYESLINNANRYIYISTPYLIIDKNFLRQLANAAKSGIDVRILLPHIPDKKLVFKISQSHYGKLLASGVKVYEYTPGFNHAKNLIVDDRYAYLGTTNVDYRSMFLHFECGNFMINDETIIKIKEDFLLALNSSKQIEYDLWKKRPFITRMVGFVLQIISPLL